MLTEHEKKEIAAELSRCVEPRAAASDALKIVMRRTRWISDQEIAEVAEVLGMTRDELDGIATAYSLIYRQPVGRHVILICDSVSCWVMGYDSLLAYFKQRVGIGFGETTDDGRFTLLPVCCLGYCDHAPAMMIDEDLYGDLDAGRMESILNSYQ